MIFLLTLLVSGIFMNALGTVTEAALVCYLIDTVGFHHARTSATSRETRSSTSS